MIEPISAAIPTIGQRQTAAKAMVAQGLQQLAMQIYVNAVSHQIIHDGIDETTDLESLQRIAKESLFAAQCYFSGLNIAQFSQEHPNG